MHRFRIPVTLAIVMLVGTALCSSAAMAQFNEPPPPAAYALQGVTLVRPDGSRTENVTVVVRRGFIEAIGTDVEIPPDAELLEGDSLLVYPGLVDAQGGAKVEFPDPEIDRQSLEPWNAPREAQGFLPQRRAADHLAVTGADLKSQRTNGVVAGAVHPDGPVMPGLGAFLIYRQDADRSSELVVQPAIGPTFTFRGARGVYPGTLFGVVAFYRQSFEDARHDGLVREAHAQDPRGVKLPGWDPAYEVLRSVMAQEQPVYFSASTAEDIRLVLELADEYQFRPVIVGGEQAWRMAAQLRERRIPVLVSLDFPDPERWKPAAETPESADTAEVAAPQVPEPLDAAAEREKRNLENLYANAGRLAAAGVQFALTSGGGEADILEGTRKAIEYGLSEEQALTATTVTPAALFAASYLMLVEAGVPATFIVTDGPLFHEDTKIAYTFVEGALERGRVSSAPEGGPPSVDVTGTWEVEIEAEGQAMSGTMTLEQEGAEFSGSLSLEMGTLQIRDGAVGGDNLTFTLVIEMGGQSMSAEAKGKVEGDEASGTGSGEMGSFTWKATKAVTPREGEVR